MEAPSHSPHKNITTILVEAGAVTPHQVDVGLARQRETGRRIGQSLVEMGFVSEEDIGWALARQLGIPFVDVRPETLDLELVRSLPEAALRRLQVVPLFRSDGRVTAAIADPTDHDAMAEFERLCGMPAACVAAAPSAIELTLDAIFGARPHAHVSAAVGTDEPYFDFHLRRARAAGVAELHFVCADGWLYVKHRTASRLASFARDPAARADELFARLAALGLESPADGEGHRALTAVTDAGGHPQALQLSLLATREGPSVTVRLLRDPEERPRLDSLGLEALDVAQLRDRLAEPSGLVLVTGPPDSGCSTTLAAMLAEMPVDDGAWAVFARDRRRWPVRPGHASVLAGPLARRWPRVAVAHALDGLVLDGGLEGPHVRSVLHSAAHGRWLLARTDWEDTFALLEWLVRAPGGRSALAHRLRAVIQQRVVATPRAQAVALASEPPDTAARAAEPLPDAVPDAALQRAVFEVLFPGEALRAALRSGAGADALRAAATAEGLHPLADVLRGGVQRGRLDPRDAARGAA